MNQILLYDAGFTEMICHIDCITAYVDCQRNELSTLTIEQTLEQYKFMVSLAKNERYSLIGLTIQIPEQTVYGVDQYTITSVNQQGNLITITAKQICKKLDFVCCTTNYLTDSERETEMTLSEFVTFLNTAIQNGSSTYQFTPLPAAQGYSDTGFTIGYIASSYTQLEAQTFSLDDLGDSYFNNQSVYEILDYMRDIYQCNLVCMQNVAFLTYKTTAEIVSLETYTVRDSNNLTGISVAENDDLPLGFRYHTRMLKNNRYEDIYTDDIGTDIYYPRGIEEYFTADEIARRIQNKHFDLEMQWDKTVHWYAVSTDTASGYGVPYSTQGYHRTSAGTSTTSANDYLAAPDMEYGIDSAVTIYYYTIGGDKIVYNASGEPYSSLCSVSELTTWATYTSWSQVKSYTEEIEGTSQEVIQLWAKQGSDSSHVYLRTSVCHKLYGDGGLSQSEPGVWRSWGERTYWYTTDNIPETDEVLPFYACNGQQIGEFRKPGPGLNRATVYSTIKPGEFLCYIWKSEAMPYASYTLYTRTEMIKKIKDYVYNLNINDYRIYDCELLPVDPSDIAVDTKLLITDFADDVLIEDNTADYRTAVTVSGYTWDLMDNSIKSITTGKRTIDWSDIIHAFYTPV